MEIIGIGADRFCQKHRRSDSVSFYNLSCVLYVYTNFLLHLHPSKTSVSNDAPAVISAALKKLVSMSHWQD